MAHLFAVLNDDMSFGLTIETVIESPNLLDTILDDRRNNSYLVSFIAEDYETAWKCLDSFLNNPN